MSAARILLIEDNASNRDLMSYLLKACGHPVSCAKDGREGLEFAEAETPDLILCDLHLPILDGFEVIRSLRHSVQLRHIPVIAVTALAMVGERTRIHAAGFDACIFKPIDPERFIQEVERFLPPELRRSLPTVDRPAPPAELAQVADDPLRPTILLVDDSSANLDVMRSTLEPFGYQTISATTGEEGLNVLRSGPRIDLVVSDFHLGDQTATEFLARKSAIPDAAHIPVAVISSTLDSLSERQRCLDLGASLFLMRPIDPQGFLSAIRSLLRPRSESPA